MNQKGGAAIWIFVIVLLAVGGWFLFSSDDVDESEEAATSTEQTTETNDVTSDNMSEIQAAIAGNGSVECTYTGDEVAEATTYISAGEVRTIAQAEGVTSNMLFQDEEIYVWQEGATEGFIMTADRDDEESNRTPVPVRPSDVEEAAVSENVSCAEADVDEALFELPDGVEFMSMADMSAGAAGQMPAQ